MGKMHEQYFFASFYIHLRILQNSNARQLKTVYSLSPKEVTMISVYWCSVTLQVQDGRESIMGSW